MEKKINKIRVKPRFKIISEVDKDAITQKLKKYILENDTIYEGNINNEVASIYAKTSHNNFWKPYLSLRIETVENKTEIRGIFGPSSAVWTFFMFLYFGLSVSFMVFITLYFVTKQIKSNDFPWAIYAAIASVVLLLITYIATKIGQLKAKKEMHQLKKIVDDVILQH